MSQLPRDVAGYEAMLGRAAEDLLAVNRRISALISHQTHSQEAHPLTGADRDRLAKVATGLQDICWHAGTTIANLGLLDIHPDRTLSPRPGAVDKPRAGSPRSLTQEAGHG